MDKTYIETHNVIDRYLQDALDAKERSAFEQLLLEDAGLLDEVQLREAMFRAFKDSPAVASAPARSNVLPFRLWLAQPLSIAASCVVVVALLALMRNVTSITGPGELQGLQIASNQLVERMRSLDTVQELRGEFPMLLTIDGGPGAAFNTFEVAVLDAANAPLLSPARLVADSEGWLRVILHQPLTGEVDIVLSAVASSGALQPQDPFRVRFVD